MHNYNDALRHIMDEGVDRKGRNGMTRALFALQLRFDLQKGFPAVTTKRLAFKQVVAELIWFLRGSSDVRELQAMDCHIWDANAEADYWKPKARFPGDLGRVYGVQWRSWQRPDGTTVDQIARVLEKLKTDPNDRRLIVSAWNPGELEQMALPPCHMLFQFFPANGTLSLHMIQRSCDMFLGVPFNIASYSLLLSMVAQVVGMKPGECILTLNDAHIYHEHFDAVKEQLSRTPSPLPTLWMNSERTTLESFIPEDFRLDNYQHHPTIKAPMIV
jgi:thymidylate synthase